jgi:hypothetical protein
MRIRLSYIAIPLLILMAGVTGWWFGLRHNAFSTTERVDAVVMLERIQNVHKLVLVEGSFSEIYDYKDYWMYDVSPFRKKALIRVKADVLIGFDLEKANIELDEEKHVLTIHHLPESEILSIDHDLDYYDLQEGTFNQFSEVKLTELGKGAKQFIQTQAQNSELISRADQRQANFIKELSLTASAMGWKVVISDSLRQRMEEGPRSLLN